MKQFIKTDLGRANQLGDGAPLVWLYEPKCWSAAATYAAEYVGTSVQFTKSADRNAGDVLVIPKQATDLEACRTEFLRVLQHPELFPK